MRILAVIAMLFIMTGLFANAGRQMFLWLTLFFKGLPRPVFFVVYAIFVVAVLAAFVVSRIPGLNAYRPVFKAGHHALGALTYMVLVVNVVSALLFAGKFIHLIPAPVPRSVQLVSFAASMILIVGFTVYGTVHAAVIRTQRYSVQIGETKTDMDSLRIALLSDVHLGYVIEEAHLAKVVEAVNTLRPDVICIAGDIFDGDITALSNPEKLQALFGGLEAKYGVYACLGNHDAGAGYRQMVEFLHGADIHVLMDEAVEIDGRFVLAGRRDSSPIGGQGDSRRAVEGVADPSLPVIVLDHQPGNIGEYGKEAGLILCGHTHRGQMFPFNLITAAAFDVDYGYYRADDASAQVIVTSGAGTWGPPLRVATDNEIVEINVMFPRGDTRHKNNPTAQ